MNLPGLLGLFCGVAVVLAGLLATYFLWVDPQKKNRWLGLLFLAIALRVGKSIGYFILYEVAAPWVALGYVGLASTGPLLWVYVRMQTGQAPLRASLLHGLLPLVGAISIWAADGAYASDWYQLTTLLLLGYLVATALRWWKSRSADRAYYWEGQVLLGTGIVWVAYVIQHLSDTMQGYAWGAAVAALPLYGLMVRMARQGRVQPKRTPKAETVPADVLQKVRAALETEQGYLQRHLTLSQ
ncbi:MAG TPA: hypothetical protein DCR93_01705, partial [Cytophagales bacterium]|nr:hypothetical protein [Cytophagales bacterium]